MQFRQRFAKKPELNALRPQFCSDDRSRALPSASRAASRICLLRGRHISESPSARCQQGETSKRTPVPGAPVTAPPPTPTGTRRVRVRARLQHHHHRHVSSTFERSSTWARAGASRGNRSAGRPERRVPTQENSCTPRIPPAVEQAPMAYWRHPAQRGPRPGDTHHTEP